MSTAAHIITSTKKDNGPKAPKSPVRHRQAGSDSATARTITQDVRKNLRANRYTCRTRRGRSTTSKASTRTTMIIAAAATTPNHIMLHPRFRL